MLLHNENICGYFIQERQFETTKPFSDIPFGALGLMLVVVVGVEGGTGQSE